MLRSFSSGFCPFWIFLEIMRNVCVFLYVIVRLEPQNKSNNKNNNFLIK